MKTGGVFLGGRSSNFKALRQKQVGCVQERQNRPVYVGQESEGDGDGMWGREQQVAVLQQETGISSKSNTKSWEVQAAG